MNETEYLIKNYGDREGWYNTLRLKVSNCDHVGRHVKKNPKTHISARVNVKT